VIGVEKEAETTARPAAYYGVSPTDKPSNPHPSFFQPPILLLHITSYLIKNKDIKRNI